ncbi:zinc ribbon domain-containing protein [Deinococcus sp. SM5_A1]|uniref:zinc ribbon domain-containing protein n=1 Tax=Deinococcus sp. SM5_A1 TaxID=3379094 RepID=UPI00385B41BD
MENTLIYAPTALRPTSAQQASLNALYDTAEQLHFTLRGWLRTVGTGVHLHLAEALEQVAGGHPLPRVDDDHCIQLCADAVAQVQALAHADLPERWRVALPAGVMRSLIKIETRRLKRGASRVRADTLLPLRPLDRVALDEAAVPVDDYHVMLCGVPEPVVADLWALPHDLTRALLTEADDRARHAAAEWAAGLERLLQGDVAAAGTLYQVDRDTWPWRERQPTLTLDRALPHRYQHVSLVRTTDESGTPRLVLHWTIRIPGGYLPKANRSGGFGVDLGYRHVATGASDQGITAVPRRVDVRRGLPEPADDRRAIHSHARMRRSCLEAHREGLEDMLKLALQHRQVNVEATDWAGILDHGRAPWSVEAMSLIGAPLLVSWIQTLAPASGTQVTLVEPAGTSRTCHHCGETGKRPWPYREFYCPLCGTSMDADHNSAAVLRQAPAQPQAGKRRASVDRSGRRS